MDGLHFYFNCFRKRLASTLKSGVLYSQQIHLTSSHERHLFWNSCWIERVAPRTVLVWLTATNDIPRPFARTDF